ncbi:unnamed protein product [Soboliphyme baturini]|uniref:Queuosine salvage protein n=1 Tax=Soboliphyme baturini TaxID=241478 RepID=A0A183IR78_9BILA|nr:unnamed protein product [Soboliphyme baturini]
MHCKLALRCFFISTINFSFWTSSEHKFEVLYDGKKYTGFLSCCALVKKSLDMGIPLTDPRYILDIDFDRFRACFTNDEGDVIPMVDERWQNLRQVSSILCEKFNGTFYECLQQSDNSAQNLLKLVVENFPCYRDWATYEDTAGTRYPAVVYKYISLLVAFLKRAQILIGDIYNLLKGEPPAAFGDIDTLTTFADYRVPQVLVYFGALQYSDELQRLLNEGTKWVLQLPCSPLLIFVIFNLVYLDIKQGLCSLGHVFSSGDVEEVEIRGCTVFAVDLVVDEVKRMLAEVNLTLLRVYVIFIFRWCLKMFKKFSDKENITSVQQLKSSVQKDVRRKVLALYPLIEPYLDQILPKKENLRILKCHEHVEILVGPHGDLLFFKSRDGPFMPTLRLLHQYPFLLPWQQVDKGAIRFVLSGAQIMCPGLTSPGAKMTDGLARDQVVAVMAECKQHAMAIGLMKLSTEEIRQTNKGVGIDNIHYINDGLWQMKPVK